jgi:hypothetical protein
LNEYLLKIEDTLDDFLLVLLFDSKIGVSKETIRFDLEDGSGSTILIKLFTKPEEIAIRSRF